MAYREDEDIELLFERSLGVLTAEDERILRFIHRHRPAAADVDEEW